MTGTAASPGDPLAIQGTVPASGRADALPSESAGSASAALQQAPWRSGNRLASMLDRLEGFLAHAGFDRGPWLTVAFACGIAAWFLLAKPAEWIGFIAFAAVISAAAARLFAADGAYPYLRQGLAALALALAAGCAVVWIKSALVGAAPIERPFVGLIAGQVLSREDEPAEQRVRLIVATRDPTDADRTIQVRVNVAEGQAGADAVAGAMVSLKARLMPPAPPMLPGGYDFARAAWFRGLAATGSALSPVRVLAPAPVAGATIEGLRRRLASHVHARLGGSPGGIAAAFASGDRGGIAREDEDAMRDAGLSHLLSVSGLHVSAVIGGIYVLALRLLALWPWLALRVRLPLMAAGLAAGGGIFYTLLTGSEVPTVRSVIGALLVLAAVALGRDALSLRLLAVAGFAVMLVWPEAVVGPSFQLSFCAVLAIIAFHASAPMRTFTAAREEPWWAHWLRRLAALLATGVVIELALLPIGLFHFHRAGVYGALANVVAIPLTTFLTMPLIAMALFMDLAGAGGPAWWLAGRSLGLLLSLAHFVSARPGAVTLLPTMGNLAFALFLAGGLWLALWRGRIRLLGLAPIAAGAAWLALLQPADVLISGDGRHVAFARLTPDKLVLLRDTRSSFARENLAETAGMDGEIIPLEQWPGARCNADFCAMEVQRGGRSWHFLLARGNDPVPLRDLAAACERSDIVIGDRWLPRSCRPAVLKADRSLLDHTGGLAIDLSTGTVDSVAASQGEHGWWRPRPAFRPAGAASPAASETGAAAPQ